MNHHPKVSVILTTFNRYNFLKVAVESVLNQTFKNFELIVMDDNSTEQNQLDYLDEIKKDDRVMVYTSDVKPEERKLTTRYATCINYALKNLVSGEYITYLCDDDRYLPTRLQDMVDYLNKRTDVSIVYGTQRRVNLNQDIETLHSLCTADRIIEKADYFLDHSSFMHRRSILEVTGLWNESPDYWRRGDIGFYEKIQQVGFKYYPLNKESDIHVYHSDSYCVSGRYENL